MHILHLVKVRFDRRTAAITQEWLDRRYEFFGQHTLPSLLAQVDPSRAGQPYKDWVLWINCQDGMQDMVRQLRFLLHAKGVKAIWTFGDQCPTIEDITLADLTLGERIRCCEYVYVTRIDSDDLYVNDALYHASQVRPTQLGEVEASIFRRGYMYDMVANRVGVYYNSSSPFHTIMYPKEAFIDPVMYGKVWNLIGDHSKVESALYSHGLPHFKFCVLIHGSNFISNFDYGREARFPGTRPELGWDLQRYLNQAVVFDVDDFCDSMGGVSGDEVLGQLDSLKSQYPYFKCTLFTIPQRSSRQLLDRAKKRSWIEIAIHGITHNPNLELQSTPAWSLNSFLASGVDYRVYTKGFKAPGWYITPEHVAACNANGLWVALNQKDATMMGPLCTYGYYACGERMPYSHHHTHDVCGNWLKADLPTLLGRWHPLQQFSFVSESVLAPTQMHNLSKSQ